MASFKNRIIPCISYVKAGEAIEWLCKAFGFEEKVVHTTDEGKVAHAELSYKGNLIMLGSADYESDWSKLIRLPDKLGGFETQSPYIIVDDIDAHYKQAKEAGADIVLPLKEQDYGGKNYSCYDPEGHLWSFGSYDPWESPEE